jgi:deazaflavin-dependent oxidoreductase (nitroreductase family)
MTRGNGLVLGVLHSPLHRVLDRSVCEIEYLGRRTGRLLRLPVQYVHDGDRLVVVAGAAGTKQWWRNFTGAGQPVTFTIAGRRRGGWARVVTPAEPGYATAVVEYGRRFGAVPGNDFRLLVIDLVGAAEPENAHRKGTT